MSYIDRGCDFDLCVAIDFTSSNGDPCQPLSLHYQSEDSFKNYEETISSIGQALVPLSSSQEFPGWGLGAKYRGILQHLFPLGGNNKVIGVYGVQAAYEAVFDTGFIMSGPTMFTTVMQVAAFRATRNHENR